MIDNAYEQPGLTPPETLGDVFLILNSSGGIAISIPGPAGFPTTCLT